MSEAARDGHDADVAALHLERLRHGGRGVRSARGRLRIRGQVSKKEEWSGKEERGRAERGAMRNHVESGNRIAAGS